MSLNSFTRNEPALRQSSQPTKFSTSDRRGSVNGPLGLQCPLERGLKRLDRGRSALDIFCARPVQARGTRFWLAGCLGMPRAEIALYAARALLQRYSERRHREAASVNLCGRIDTTSRVERSPTRCRAEPLRASARCSRPKPGPTPYAGDLLHCTAPLISIAAE